MRRAFLEKEGLSNSFDEKIISYQQRDNKVLAGGCLPNKRLMDGYWGISMSCFHICRTLVSRMEFLLF